MGKIVSQFFPWQYNDTGLKLRMTLTGEVAGS